MQNTCQPSVSKKENVESELTAKPEALVDDKKKVNYFK